VRKRDILRGLDDQSGPDGRPPEASDPESASRRLAWAIVGALAFFAFMRLFGAA
jgi:hypothetical protein